MIEKSYAYALAFLGLDPATEFHSDNLSGFKSGNPIPFWNIAIATASFSSTDLQALKQYFESTPYTILVSEQDKVGKQTLESLSFQCVQSFPAMVANRTSITPYIKDEHISVQEITDEVSIFHTWVPLLTQAYAMTDGEKEFREFIQYLRRTQQHETIKFFIGSWQGTPVATGMLIVYQHIAALHFVGTIPSHRNKGVGNAVSCYALHTLDQQNIKKIFLLTSPMGKPIYEKIGFTIDAQYDMYVLST